jgi:4-hydroxybenzoate polyprenyltransferase
MSTITPMPNVGQSIKALALLARPKQWTKNLLVFAALIFTGKVAEAGPLMAALGAFAAMCLASSGTYVLNDFADAERDRLHPKKKNRPIASGLISPAAAVAWGGFLLAASLALAFWMGRGEGVIILAYLGLQVAYNARLKRVAVADVFCIAIGFVLRASLGAAALSAPISGWLLFCTGALALMLGFGKRRMEFINQGEDRARSRESLVHYTQSALDALVPMFATAAALCYGLYTLQSRTAEQHPGLILTAPFVFYGITRYVLLMFTLGEGEEPGDVLFRDPHLLACIALFLAMAITAVSGVSLPLIER